MKYEDYFKRYYEKDPYERIRDIAPVKSILDDLFDVIGFKDKFTEFLVVDMYNDFNKEEKMISRAVNVKKGRLIVETDNSATSNLLSLKKNVLIQKINEKIGKKMIKDIIFIISKKGDILE